MSSEYDHSLNVWEEIEPTPDGDRRFTVGHSRHVFVEYLAQDCLTCYLCERCGQDFDDAIFCYSPQERETGRGLGCDAALANPPEYPDIILTAADLYLGYSYEDKMLFFFRGRSLSWELSERREKEWQAKIVGELDVKGATWPYEQ